MKNRLFQTNDSWTPVSVRILLGLVVLGHGTQKLFGWFGGYGFSGTMDFFTQTVGLPWGIGFLVIILESVGALALVAGLGTRLIAMSYSVLAAGIAFTVHVQNGFFMNWSGNQHGEGYEFFLLWIGMSVSLVISGGGKYSMDKKIMMKEVKDDRM